MKEKFRQWMAGRYIGDPLNQFITRFAIILILLNIIVFKSRILSGLSLALAFYAFYRSLSRDIDKRSRENAAFLRKTTGLRKGITRYRRRLFGEGGYRYFACPSCGKELRVPKGKGKVKVRCPHCKHEMEKRT